MRYNVPGAPFALDRKCLIIAIAVGLLLSINAGHAYTVSGGRLTEDFSTAEQADFANSTGLWNAVDHVAQAAVIANGKPVSFGDGSDGILDSSSGYSFDTDTHSNGYNFLSVNIAGGSISVTGSHPLILRSLTTVNIASPISLNGAPGTDGTYNAGTTAPAGGAAAPTCSASGGSGGAASGAAASDGTKGYFNGLIDSDGGAAAGTAGLGIGVAGVDATLTLSSRARSPFDTAGYFTCGAGGAGGGGRSDVPGDYSTGGGGGGGGGVIRIAGVGDVTVGAITANGGNPGRAANDGAAGPCSGHGVGGGGGSIWLQTYKILTTTTEPSASKGSATSATCGVAVDGWDGRYRGDSASGAVIPAWVGAIASQFATANAATSTSYTVISKPYDLRALNAGFQLPPSITSTTNGGAVSISYAGSADKTNFSAYTTDITTLSNQGYRYLKFKIDITTAGVAGPSPTVSQIAIDYNDFGLEKLDAKLSLGCGMIQDAGGGRRTTPSRGLLMSAVAFALWSLAYGFVRKARDVGKIVLPA